MVLMRSKWSLPPPGGGGAGGTGWSTALDTTRRQPAQTACRRPPHLPVPDTTNGPPPSPWGRAVVVRTGRSVAGEEQGVGAAAQAGGVDHVLGGGHRQDILDLGRRRNRGCHRARQ